MSKTVRTAALAAIVWGLSAVGSSSAVSLNIDEGTPKLQGARLYDYQTGQFVSTAMPGSARELTVAYDSTYNANAAFSRANTDLPVYGDYCGLVDTGRLQTVWASIFNPSTGVGNIDGGTLTLNFYDATTFSGWQTSTPLGTVSGSISGLALPPGYYTFIGFENLDAAGIDLPLDIVLTQRFIPVGGTRNGFVSGDPVSVGFGNTPFYMRTATLAEGWYNFTGINTNLMYYIEVPEPASLGLLAAVGVLALRRRM